MEHAKDIHFFNLCDNRDISANLVLRAYNSITDTVTKESLELFFCDEQNSQQRDLVFEGIDSLDLSYLSVYSLLSVGVRVQVIERLQEKYASVKELALHFHELQQEFHFKQKTLDAIQSLAVEYYPNEFAQSEQCSKSPSFSFNLPSINMLFNLCEKGHSHRTVFRLGEALKWQNTFSSKEVADALGSNPTSSAIIESLRTLDTSYTSVYALSRFGISGNVITKLCNTYSSLESIAANVGGLSKLGFHDKTLNGLIDTISTLVPGSIINASSGGVCEEDCILDVLDRENERLEGRPIEAVSLFRLVSEELPSISAASFYQIINDLAAKGKLKVLPSGVLRLFPELEQYIGGIPDSKNMQVLNRYLLGDNQAYIASSLGVSRQRIDQILAALTKKLPIFENEKKAFSILCNYRLSLDAAVKSEVCSASMYNYIKAKYSPHPMKTEVDFVIDTQLTDSPAGDYILRKNNFLFIDGELIALNAFVLLELFLGKNDITTFVEADLERAFVSFLVENRVDYASLMGGVSFRTKLNNAGFVLNYGSGHYYFFDKDRFSEEFLAASRRYIEGFYGYGSVEHFFDLNKELCSSNGIQSEYLLFAILKKLYEDEYSKEIEFVRNPTIATKGLSKDEFYANLIEELSPITESELVDFIASEYGTKKATLLGNASFKKFVGADGYLHSDVCFDDKCQEIQGLLEKIGARKMLPTVEFSKYYKDLPQEFKEGHTERYILSKLGYKYTNDVIYCNDYASVYEALCALSDELNIIENETFLARFLPIEWCNSRYSIVKQSCLFLKCSEDGYLNTKKRINLNELLSFRDEVIGSLEVNRIYTLNDLYDAYSYKRLLQAYPEIARLLNVSSSTLLKSLLQSSLKITNLEADVFVFGKGERVTVKRLVRSIVEEYGSIEKSELLESLSDRYGIDSDFSGVYFFEIGMFYEPTAEKVYSSKKLWEQELVEYLNMKGVENELD